MKWEGENECLYKEMIDDAPLDALTDDTEKWRWYSTEPKVIVMMVMMVIMI